jgi:cell division protease FtsH
MSDLGPIQFGRGSHQVFLGRDFGDERNYSEEVAFKIDEEVRKIIESCYESGRSLLKENWSKVERLVKQLLEFETVEADEVLAIIQGRPYDRNDGGSGVTATIAEAERPAVEEPKREPKRLPPTISPEPA